MHWPVLAITTSTLTDTKMTSKTDRSKLSRLLAIAPALLLTSCATTSLAPGKPLPGLMLQAAGENVMLAWAPASPLARQLGRGSAVNLLADYQSADGDVSGERVAAAQVDVSRNMVVLTLPQQLGRVPTGNVCLRLVSNRRQAIPLRVAAAGQSSDAFRFAEWERVATDGTRRRDLDAARESVEANLARLADGQAEALRWQDARGLQGIEQCRDIRATHNVIRPDTAIEADKRAIAARLQCVWQYGRTARLIGLWVDRRIEAGALAAQVTASLAGRPQQARAREIEQYIAAHKDVLPLREALLDFPVLGTTQSTDDAIKENKGVMDGPTSAAIVSAFDVCLDEATAQFAQSYDAWQAELNAPIAAERTALLQAECVDVFESAARTADRVREQENRLAGLEAEMAALGSPASLAAVENRSLIGEDCRP